MLQCTEHWHLRQWLAVLHRFSLVCRSRGSSMGSSSSSFLSTAWMSTCIHPRRAAYPTEGLGSGSREKEHGHLDLKCRWNSSQHVLFALCWEHRRCLAKACRAGGIGGLWLKHKEGLLSSALAVLKNARVSESACAFNLELVLLKMPARST